MASQIALFRGVNVGGNILTMERVRELWLEQGFKNVRTYVQSGNVVFEGKVAASKKMEQALAGETRLPVTVLLRTAAEMGNVIARNPFLKDKVIDRSKLHVTFLESAAPKDAAVRLGALKAGEDQFRIAGKEIYVYCPNGYGRTKLTNNAIEKVLSLRATTRNWNTVNKLFEMAGE